MSEYREQYNVPSGTRLVGTPVLAVRYAAGTDRSGGSDGNLASLQVDDAGNLRVIVGSADASTGGETGTAISTTGAEASAGMIFHRENGTLDLLRYNGASMTYFHKRGAAGVSDPVTDQYLPLILLELARLRHERSRRSGIDLGKLTARDLLGN